MLFMSGILWGVNIRKMHVISFVHEVSGMCLSVYLSVCLSVYLSVCLSVSVPKDINHKANNSMQEKSKGHLCGVNK